jgi:hypothetical protein
MRGTKKYHQEDIYKLGIKKVLIERDINNNDECMKYYVRIEVLYKRTTLE